MLKIALMDSGDAVKFRHEIASDVFDALEVIADKDYRQRDGFKRELQAAALNVACVAASDPLAAVFGVSEWVRLIGELKGLLGASGVVVSVPTDRQILAFLGRESVREKYRPKVEVVEVVKARRSEWELKNDFAHGLACLELALQIGRDGAVQVARLREVLEETSDRSGFMAFLQGWPVEVKKFFV